MDFSVLSHRPEATSSECPACVMGPPSHLLGIPCPDTHPSSSGKRLPCGPLCGGLMLTSADMLPGSWSPALPFWEEKGRLCCGRASPREAEGAGEGLTGDTVRYRGYRAYAEGSQQGQDQPWPPDTRKERPTEGLGLAMGGWGPSSRKATNQGCHCLHTAPSFPPHSPLALHGQAGPA